MCLAIGDFIRELGESPERATDEREDNQYPPTLLAQGGEHFPSASEHDRTVPEAWRPGIKGQITDQITGDS
jgi:hypothetical protein